MISSKTPGRATSAKATSQIQSKGIWHRFFHLVKAVKVPWILIIISIGIGLLSTKVSSLFPDYQIQITGGDVSSATVTRALLLLGGSILISVVSRYTEIFTQLLIVKRSFDTVWGKVLRLPVRTYQDTEPRELISRITSDTRSFGQIFMVVLTQIFTETYALYLSLTFVFSYHRYLGYVQLGIIPAVIIFKLIQGKINFKLTYRLQDRLSGLTAYLSQILVNIPLVKVFVKEDHETIRGEETIKEYNRIRFRSDAFQMICTNIDGFIVALNSIASVLMGVYLIRRGELDVPTWIAFFMYSQTVIFAIQALVDIWPNLKGVQGSVERVSHFMEKDSEKYEGLAMPEKIGEIRLDDVYFSYGEAPVLNGVSVTIPGNSLTAIVGKSGAGKTTFLALLERFFDPDQGVITLDGQDISEIGIKDWRSKFAYVTQERNIFAGTIRENITYGIEREVSDQEIELACKQAEIFDSIMELEDGFDTYIQDGGEGLSGGESQRIALARTMLKRSPIILLDEATANLDAENECMILDSLDELYQGRTTVAVAHRLCTVVHADKIIVLHKGKVLAEGTHTELLEKCPHYADLVKAEFNSYGEENLDSEKEKTSFDGDEEVCPC